MGKVWLVLKEVSGFDQDQAPFAAERLVLAEVRAAYPASLRIVTMLVREHTFNDKNFLTAVMSVGVEVSARCPSHHRRVGGTVFPQGEDCQARHQSLAPRRLASGNHHTLPVMRVKVSQFDKKKATLFRKRGVLRTWRILDVSAGAVISNLITQSAFQHQNFFPQFVRMSSETGSWRIPHYRRGPRNLSPIALQLASLHQG